MPTTFSTRVAATKMGSHGCCSRTVCSGKEQNCQHENVYSPFKKETLKHYSKYYDTHQKQQLKSYSTTTF